MPRVPSLKQGLTRVVFDQTKAPALLRGAKLGASGVDHPSLRTIGGMSGLPATDGSFSAHGGFPQIAQFDDFIWVPDDNNHRIQRFTRTTGTGNYVFTDKCSALDAFGGALKSPVLAAYDPILDELHFACWDDVVAGTWVGVWARATWPALTVANRVRSYGSNGVVDAAGQLLNGMGLTIDSSLAACISFGGTTNRIVVYDHTTGAVHNQLAQAAASRYMRFATDGAGRWWTGCVSGAAVHPGFHEADIDTAGIPSLGRIDLSTTQGAARWKRFRVGLEVTDVIYYNGRLYVREIFSGMVKAWTDAGVWVDEFLFPGGASSTEQFGSSPLVMDNSSQPAYGKMGLWLAPLGASDPDCDDLFIWSSHADNGADQSWLSVIPLSTSTAEWSQSVSGRLKGFLVAGEQLGSEKVRVEYRKNAGAWHTVPYKSLGDSGVIAGLGDDIYAGDTLGVKLSMSTWDRLDGHPTLTACRDKLPPKNVTVQALLDAL